MIATQTATYANSTRDLLRVAIPVSLGYFVQFFVVFIDNLFLAHIDGNAMSASSYTGLIFVTIAMLGIGMSNATQILIARKHATQKWSAVGDIMSNALWIALALGLMQFCLLFFFVPWFAQHLIPIQDLAHYMAEFSQYRAFGFLFYTLTLCLNAYWSGTAQTHVLFVSTAVTATVTVVLDYFLIFGNAGFPEMGVQGAALANTIADACALLAVAYFTFRKPKTEGSFAVHPFHLLREKWMSGHTAYTKQLLKLGSPIAFQLLISLGIWAIFYHFVTSMGEGPLQASFIVRNMYMLAYVSVSGFSTTTKTYVAALLAQKRTRDLLPTIKRIMLLNVAGIVLLCHGLLFYPHWLAQHFSNNPEIIQQTVQTMYIVFPAMVLFACTSILLATVEGSGKTMAGFVIEMITVLIYIAVAYYMIHIIHLPIHLAWTADYVYFAVLGVLSLLYLKFSGWKSPAY